MTCQRCGYCCIQYDVVIIHPDFVKDELIIDELPDEAFMYKQCNYACPYLEYHNNNAFCTIHHYDWYKETPCYSHNFNQRCLLGEHIKKSVNMLEKLKNTPKLEVKNVK